MGIDERVILQVDGEQVTDVQLMGCPADPVPAERITAEQRARDMLDSLDVPNAQSYTSGDLVELANLIADFRTQAEQIATLQADVERHKSDLAEAWAQLQWVGECIEGQDVSEFAESFPLVRAVSDLKAQLREARALLQRVLAAWADQSAMGDTLTDPLYIEARAASEETP